MMRLNINQLKKLDQRAKSGNFTSEDCQLLRTLIASHKELINLLKNPDTSLDDVFQYLPSDDNDIAIDGAAGDGIESRPEERHE